MIEARTTTRPTRTLLIVSPTLLRELLGQAVQAWIESFELIGEAEGSADGLALCQKLSPDLVLLDAQLEDGDSVELARLLLRRLPSVRILALLAEADPVRANRLQEVGIQGLIEMDQSVEILQEALLEVAAGRRYFTAAAVRDQCRLRDDPRAFSKFLTGREQDVLRHVLEGRTSKDIAHRLHLSPRSIETFRYRLMRKLQVRNVAGLLEFAVRHGMVKA